MWESPIQMITDDIVKDIEQKQDEWLMESVYRAGLNIDKDELMKALNYDRDQYEKGYADGRWARDSDTPTVDVVERKKGKWKQGCCTECGYNWGKDAPIASVPNYCPNCGADMRKETEDE